MILIVAQRAAVLALICFLVACAAPSERLGRNLLPISNKIELAHFPKIGDAYISEVGNSIFYAEKKLIQPMLELLEPYSVSASNVGKKFSIAVAPGKMTAVAVDGDGVFYEARSGSVSADGSTVGVKSAGVYVPNQSRFLTEIYVLTADGRPLNYPAPGMNLNFFTSERAAPVQFKQELIYLGVSKGVVSVLYREFSDNFARPAFSQELRYDISEGAIVGFRGARFEILGASNTGLKYKAISHLN